MCKYNVVCPKMVYKSCHESIFLSTYFFEMPQDILKSQVHLRIVLCNLQSEEDDL